MTDMKRKLKELIAIALLAEAVEQDEKFDKFKKQKCRFGHANG